ncbi:hypothetical protein [Maribacter sp. 2-571]|uniref:hypothetical protein n=1 Tax=Maribacter sp. 2-571 TaxID=3417569 RepID=UPI003D35623C
MSLSTFVGGAINGAEMAQLPGGDGDSAMGALVGGFSSVVGGAAGRLATKSLGRIAINGLGVKSPVLKGTIGGVLGGAGGGYAGSFAGG